jgi:hypothetical protein
MRPEFIMMISIRVVILRASEVYSLNIKETYEMV